MLDAEIRQINETVLGMGDLTKVDPKALDAVQEQIRVLLEKATLSHHQHIQRME